LSSLEVATLLLSGDTSLEDFAIASPLLEEATSPLLDDTGVLPPKASLEELATSPEAPSELDSAKVSVAELELDSPPEIIPED
jgi:hypothetical protein